MEGVGPYLRPISLCISVAVVLASCGGGSPADEEGATSTTREQVTSSSGAETTSDPEAALECQREGYPCSLAEVPIEVIEQSDAIGNEIIVRLEAGESTAGVGACASMLAPSLP